MLPLYLHSVNVILEKRKEKEKGKREREREEREEKEKTYHFGDILVKFLYLQLGGLFFLACLLYLSIQFL